MPEKPLRIVKVLCEKIETTHAEKFVAAFPSAAKCIYGARLKDLSLQPRRSSKGVRIEGKLRLHIIYVEAVTMVLKLFVYENSFNIFVRGQSIDADCFCYMKLNRDSFIHLSAPFPEHLALNMKLYLAVSLFKNNILKPAESNACSEVSAQVNPKQTYIIPDIGTIHIEVE